MSIHLLSDALDQIYILFTDEMCVVYSSNHCFEDLQIAAHNFNTSSKDETNLVLPIPFDR